MSSIVTESLGKTYGRNRKQVVGLRGVDLAIDSGDFVSVVGPSGSGKTTLLLSLGGLIRPSSGRVLVDGISIYDANPSERIEIRRSRMGFLFQTFNLIPYLTALENTQIPLMIAGKNPHEQREAAES